MHDDESIASEIEAVLAQEIRPALSAHVGQAVLEAVNGRTVDIGLRLSCRSCYFRRGCIDNLIRPALERHFGDRLDFRIAGRWSPDRAPEHDAVPFSNRS